MIDHDHAQVLVRHVTRTDEVAAPGDVAVLGATFRPQPDAATNGPAGFLSGRYERRRDEEGSAQVIFPNAPGSEGGEHVDRFRILTDPDYKKGDEWIEVYRTVDGRRPGLPEFVGTPVSADVTNDRIVLELVDGLEVLKLQRETDAGWWANSPRDVFEHYTRVWTRKLADDFTTPNRFTFSTSTQTTTDGVWNYTRAQQDTAGAVTLLPSSPSGVAALVSGNVIRSESGAAWRVEFEFERGSLAGTDEIELVLEGLLGEGYQLAIRANLVRASVVGSPSITQTVSIDTAPGGPYRLAIEGRDRWTFFLLDGRIVTLLPSLVAATDLVVAVRHTQPTAGTGRFVRVNSILARQTASLLQRAGRGGDHHLPGSPPPGGLIGEYYDDHDLFASFGAAWRQVAHNPLRKPYARRQDSVLNFPAATPPNFIPARPQNGEYFSVRWTGSIYLDLATTDRHIAFNFGGSTGVCRIWVGRTRQGEQIISLDNNVGNALSTGLRTHLGTQAAGWYPIVIEVSHATGQGGFILYDSATSIANPAGGGATYITPSARLSPVGIYQAHPRLDSHYEQLLALRDTYGVQFTCAPRGLESGEFPGRCDPRVRIGRDTDKVLDVDEATDARRRVDASDSVSTLLLDAQGIADDAAATTTLLEGVRFDAVNASHPWISTDLASVADISIRALAAQRAQTLVALRATPWEEIGARPAGRREPVDTFPLTDQLSTLKWEPGDAVRVRVRRLRVADTTPRPILGVTWPFAPGGIGRPEVAFRQRPRSAQRLLRDAVRAPAVAARTYQGSIGVVTTERAANPVQGSQPTAAVLALPENLEDLLELYVIVEVRTAPRTTPWTLRMNAIATTFTVNAEGRYPIRALAARDTAFPGRLYIDFTGGDGAIFYNLEAIVRV